MKGNFKSIFLLTGLLACAVTGVMAQSPGGFDGTWNLDMQRTGDLPPGLKSYTLTVKQDEKQLHFEAKVEGDLTPASTRDNTTTTLNNRTSPTSPVQATTGTGVAGVSGSSFSDTEGVSGGSRVIIARGRAFATVIRRMTSNLDGEERTREIAGLSPGKIRRKAFWKEPGKSLELQIARDFDAQGTTNTATVREQWELLDNGKVLKIRRTVNLLVGWDEITLFFNRQ